MFRVCSGHVIFGFDSLKKNWGVFWACSGRVVLLHFFTKILGRVPGVFSVFQCVQCVISTDPPITLKIFTEL